jgi:hypothetical protein
MGDDQKCTSPLLMPRSRPAGRDRTRPLVRRRDTRGGLVTIGGSAALIIIGAILRFGVTWVPQYVNIQAVGVILMLGGIIGLALSLWLMFLRRRRETDTEVTEHRHYVEPRT